MASRQKRKKKGKTPPKRIDWWKLPTLRTATILLLLSFLVFGNSINNGYTYDDKPFIERNYLVQQGIKGIPTLLVTDFWEGYSNVHNVNPSYRPLPLVTLALEYQFFGLNPAANHFFNVLFYGLTCIILYLLLHYLFKDKYPYLALVVSLLFCVHPIHTEVVANVKGRDDLLALLNGLLALLFLFRYIDSRKVRTLGIALFCFVLALLSKGHIITWVAVIPLFLYFFSKLSFSQIAKFSSPFWGIAFLYFFLRKSFLGAATISQTDFIDNPILGATTIGEAWATKIAVLGLFLKKLLVPVPLVSDYSFSAIAPTNWSDPEVYIWLSIYIGLIYFAFRGLKKRKILSFSIFLFAILIAPVSNVFFDYVVAFAERAMYTPSLGFVILLGVIFYKGFNKVRSKWPNIRQRSLQQYAGGGLGIVLVIFVMLSILRNPVWKDDLTLFSTDLETHPTSIRLNILYAEALIERNTALKPVPMNAELQKASECLDQVLSLTPDLARGQLLYGNVYKATGDYERANQYYSTALEIDGNNPAIHFNLGLVAQIGGNLDVAKQHYERSLELFPNYARALSNIGIIYGSQNQLDKCIEVLEKAVTVNPRLISAYQNLENAWTMKGNPEKATFYRERRQGIQQEGVH